MSLPEENIRRWEKRLMKFTGNSEYKVVIVHSAKTQFAQILRYIRQDLGNEQAARNVKEDMEETRLRLSYVAGSLKLCDDPK
jgi:NADPH:quinone reductase-like Zn-dependent oxidoreductase